VDLSKNPGCCSSSSAHPGLLLGSASWTNIVFQRMARWLVDDRPSLCRFPVSTGTVRLRHRGLHSGLGSAGVGGHPLHVGIRSYRSRVSSRWMLGSRLDDDHALHFIASIAPAGHWLLMPAAVLMGALPLAISLFNIRSSTIRFAGRWCCFTQCFPSIFCLSRTGPVTALTGL